MEKGTLSCTGLISFTANTNANIVRWTLRITRGLCLKLVEEALSFLHSFRHQLGNKWCCFFKPVNEKKAKWQLMLVGVTKRICFSLFKRFGFYRNSCSSRFIGYLGVSCATLMDFQIRYWRELSLKHLHICSTGHLWTSSILLVPIPKLLLGIRLERKGKEMC